MDLEIKKSIYQGYVWYSDQTKPVLLDRQEFELNCRATENPFVVEALLYDGTYSIQVRYVDGSYRVRQVCLAEMEQQMVFDRKEDVLSFMPHRMSLDGRKLLFRRYWKTTADALCEGMDVLLPQPLVFVGFDNE